MIEEKILDQFACSGCGTCCRWTGSVLLTDADVKIVAAALEMSESDFIEQRTRLAPNRKQLALLDQEDGSCEFLEGSRCAIYGARPEQCRTFPYAWSASGCPELDQLLARENSIE